MITKEHYIDGKKIEIFDDLFEVREKHQIYDFIERSIFKVKRIPANWIPTNQPTLKSEYSFIDSIKSGFFNKNIVEIIKRNNLRVNKIYVNLCTASDIYEYHVDGFTKGSLTMIYYANLKWQPNWEGETHFSNNENDIDYCSSFIPGRLVLFDGSIPHKSTQPSFLAEQYRYVYVVKLVCDEDPLWNTSGDITDFVFDEFPNLTDKEIKAIEFIKKRTKMIDHSGSTLYQHLYKTFCILKSQNQSEDVCLAGLYHSVYGTDYFDANLNIKKEDVIKYIGEYSESLVSEFCTNDRDNNILHSNKYKLSKQLDLLRILYANLIEQEYRFDDQYIGMCIDIKNKIELIEQ